MEDVVNAWEHSGHVFQLDDEVERVVDLKGQADVLSGEVRVNLPLLVYADHGLLGHRCDGGLRGPGECPPPDIQRRAGEPIDRPPHFVGGPSERLYLEHRPLMPRNDSRVEFKPLGLEALGLAV